jgi:sugar/nucleoside kinase (ribokinase family)
MTKFLVSGLINLETTLQVEAFPISYEPVRYPFHGVASTVSGVGFNISKALSTLGDQMALLSLIGDDPPGWLARQTLAQDGLSDAGVLVCPSATAQSVILYEPGGRRQIHVDLKDIQEQVYPPDSYQAAVADCDLAILCNINFSRPMLATARQAGVQVACDVHTISNLEDAYNQDFMAAADILFMSDEKLPCSPEDWARRVLERYAAEIVVIGLGAQGALLAVRRDEFIGRFPSVHVRPVVNTIGAGDALFACFLHEFGRHGDPYKALSCAQIFAAYKIGAAGAAQGFLDAPALQALCDQRQIGNRIR